MAHPFRYYLRIRYAECDAQKVVFNARYGEYIDVAVLEFLRAVGLDSSVFNGPLDYQLVRQTIEWKGPARFDQVLELSVFTRQLGQTSFTMGVDFRLAGEEHVLARAETVYVLVDAANLTKTPLSAEFRARLEAGAPDRYIDHAGWRSATGQQHAAALAESATGRSD